MHYEPLMYTKEMMGLNVILNRHVQVPKDVGHFTTFFTPTSTFIYFGHITSLEALHLNFVY